MASQIPLLPFLRPLRLPQPSTLRHFLHFSTSSRCLAAAPQQQRHEGTQPSTTPPRPSTNIRTHPRPQPPRLPHGVTHLPTSLHEIRPPTKNLSGLPPNRASTSQRPPLPNPPAIPNTYSLPKTQPRTRGPFTLGAIRAQPPLLRQPHPIERITRLHRLQARREPQAYVGEEGGGGCGTFER